MLPASGGNPQDLAKPNSAYFDSATIIGQRLGQLVAGHVFPESASKRAVTDPIPKHRFPPRMIISVAKRARLFTALSIRF
jgi:hypothetical protein